MEDELEKHLEGSGCGLSEALSQNFPRGTQKEDEAAKDSWCPG
jgi:hypothetical protein